MATAKLTKKDEYRREVASGLADARRDLRRAIARESEASQELKDAKELKKAAQIRVNDLSLEIEEIEDGRYQPKLFTSNGAASKNGKAATKGKGDKKKPEATGELPPDAGAALPISEFKNFGLKDSDIEKIENCPCHPKTIGEFEAWQRTDELWNRKIKGLGESGITKLQDAHAALRLQYPMPTDENRKTAVESGAGQNRNAEGGESCALVDHRSTKKGDEFSVTVAIGIVQSKEGNTFRSCTSYTVGRTGGGREVPRVDSPVHTSRSEAGRAALTDLIEQFEREGGKRKQIASQLKQWRDKAWKDVGKIDSETGDVQPASDAATDAPSK